MTSEPVEPSEADLTKSVHILTTTSKLLLTKRWNPSGCEGYDNAKWFTRTEEPVSDIFELSKLLEELESEPHRAVIRGRLKDECYRWNKKKFRRLLFPKVENKRTVKATIESQPRHWILFDIDKLSTPAELDPQHDPETAISYVIEHHLPAVFRTVTTYWQWSSSMGVGSDGWKILKLHLWYWLAKPYDCDQLKSWFADVDKKKIIDHSPFNPVQIHYTAKPLFDGVDDPIAQRSGLRQGTRDDVLLVIEDEPIGEVAGVSKGGYKSSASMPPPDILEKAGALIKEAWPREASGYHDTILAFAGFLLGRLHWPIVGATTYAETVIPKRAGMRPGEIAEAFKTTADQIASKGKPTGYTRFASIVGEAKAAAIRDVLTGPHNFRNGTRQRPVINMSGKQFRDILEDTWQAVLSDTTPLLFQRGGMLTRVRHTDTGPILETMKANAVHGLIAEIADWKKTMEKRGKFIEYDVSPNKSIANVMEATPDSRLPPIEAIIGVPAFGADGVLIDSEGYHRKEKLWLNLGDLKVPSISDNPSPVEREDARKLLMDKLLVDFVFARPSDKAHMIAALLLPFIRRLVNGCTPLHLIEASTPGTGKGLLASLIGIVAQGRPTIPTTVPEKDDEMRKKITSELMQGRSIVQFDNVSKHLNSSDLAAILTAEVWSDRILGVSSMADLPNQTTWLLTANNITFSTEIARRCARVRLEAKTETPWTRTDFDEKDLAIWALANRSQLVWSCLTLVQAWIADGQKPSSHRLGSFERWSRIMGGILETAEIDGFLANQKELYDEADPEMAEWKQFLSVWWSTIEDIKTTEKNKAVTSKELRYVAIERDLLGGVLGDGNERSQVTRLGKALGKHRDRWIGGKKIVRSLSENNAYEYRLVKTDGPEIQDVGEGYAPDVQNVDEPF